MANARVLITGGAGNIGGSLARHLESTGKYEVLVVDNLQTGSLEKLPATSSTFHFVRADVNHYEEVAPIFSSYRPDYVFHYAAVVGVARTLSNPMEVLKDIDGIRNVLTLSKGTGVKRVFYSSSSEVYGEPVELPQREETTPLNSRLPYAVVKNLGEIYFRTFHREYALPVTIFRFFNTYGPLQSEDFVISKFVARAIRGDDLTIYGDGKQTRTFCYVDDSIEFQVKCLENDLFVNETVNVGSDQEIEIVELAELVKKLINPKLKTIQLPALPEGDMTRRRPDNSRMVQTLGRALLPLSDGIMRTAEFLRSRT
ncbi:MAG TPA: NAD-dependent epimerase/dehydratase family protein [Sphingomicrobium sp.]|nr:NAD-dependent epimerase/dehydratase family protein [Sphingomicrobium sp.]